MDINQALFHLFANIAVSLMVFVLVGQGGVANGLARACGLADLNTSRVKCRRTAVRIALQNG